MERLGGGKLHAPAGFFPRSGQHRKQRHRPHRHGPALAALYAVVEPYGCRPRGGVFPRQPGNLIGRDARQLRRSLRGPFLQAPAQFLKALGKTRHIIGIVQVLANDDVHHGQG